MAKSKNKKKSSAPQNAVEKDKKETLKPEAAEAEKTKDTKSAEKSSEETSDQKAKNPSDDALESFLNRSNTSEKDDEKPAEKKKLSRGSIALIVAIVAVAALIIAVIMVINKPVEPIKDEDLPVLPAEFETTVDEKGEHHVEIATDEKGEVKQNGYGELVSYVPAQIEKIEVENSAGSFVVNATTNAGEATVYTITGFEGFDLRPGTADAIANDAATVSFTTVVAVGGDPEEFGLEEPNATVKVTYTDGTTAVFRVGNKADGGAGTYAGLGDSDDIFLVPDDAVDSFLFNVLDLISYDITPAADTVENGTASVVELSGTRYPDPITIVPNDVEEVKNEYRLSTPYEMFADNYECNDILGSIRDLYAESVVCVNPSDSQLADLGVAKPYAQVHAVYPDTQITLACSAPDDDGKVNLYYPDKGIIYSIRGDVLGWANSDLEQLLPKTVIELNNTTISHITVNSGGKSYSVDVDSAVKKIENDSGAEDEIVTIKASLDGKRIPEDSFNIFFRNFNLMKNLGMVKESGANIVYEWKVSYHTDRADDTISVYDTGGKSCPVALNGILIGSTSKSHISSLQQDILDLKDGKIPKNL